MKLKTWLVIVIPIIVVSVSLLTTFLSRQFMMNLSNDWKDEYVKSATERIFTQISAEQEKAKLIIETLLKNSEIVDAFVRNDREKLIALVMPFHEFYNKNFDLAQIHFHTADVVSFLRTSNLQKYGDDLKSFRQDILQVKNTRNAVLSLSVGVAGPMIRYIAPIVHKGEYVGSVEANVNLAEGFTKKLKGEAIIRAFFDEKGNKIDLTAKSRADMEDFTNVFNLDEVLKGNIQSFVKNEYAYVAIPLKDFSGKTFAVVFQRQNVSRIARSERTSMIVQLISAGTISISFAIVSLLFGRVLQKKIDELRKKLIEVSRGDFTTKFDSKGKDEISQMGSSLSEVISSLRDSFKNIVKDSISVRDAAQDLRTASIKLTENVERFKSSFNQVTNDSKEASNSLTEITTSVDEVAISATNIAKAAQELSENANTMSQTAKNSFDVVKNIVEMIHESRKKVNETINVVNDVSENAKNIKEIVETINSISEQTNLLALNAAIEAARAGEAGRGFAVVADQIRKLAEQSKSATSKITSILGSIQTGVERVVKAANETASAVSAVEQRSEKVGQSLNDILKQSSTVANMVDSLAASSQELSASAEEMSSAVNSATNSIKKIAEQISTLNRDVESQTEMARALNELSQKLEHFSQDLKDSANKFKVN